MAPNLTSWSRVSLSFLNLRIVSAGPSIASGGTMALTREPSARRASQIGEDSSTRRPTWLTMRWQIGALDAARDFDEHRSGAVDHDVGDVVARQQRLQRTVPQNVVADVVEQLFLLGDRHHDVLDRDDLVDDIADFLARRLAIELGELGKVDRFDQGAEDGRLDLIIAVRPPRFHGGRRRRWFGWCDRRRGNSGRRGGPRNGGRRTGNWFRYAGRGFCRPLVAFSATLTKHDSTPCGLSTLPAASRSGVTGTNPAAFWFRRGLSAVARSAGTSRWCDEWR